MTAAAAEVASLIRQLRSRPLDVSLYLRLANAYTSGAEHEKAGLTLRHAVEVDPGCHETWVRLATLQTSLAQWRDAIDSFEQACRLGPLDGRAWCAYGSALLGAQDLARAIEVRDLMLGKHAERAETHLFAGHVSRIQGDTLAADAAYHRALTIDPAQSDALFNLVDLAVPQIDDPLYEQLRERWRTAHADRDVANIGFALARVLERSGQTDESFELYRQANAASAALAHGFGHGYQPQAADREVERIIECFTPATFAQRLDPLKTGLRMIFIVGMPRSGTTLVERILGSHPRVASGGELPFMPQHLETLLAARTAAGRSGALLPRDAAERGLLTELRHRYLDALFERELDAPYVIDKLPANFSALGLIRVLFPDALLVHCTRDPAATCWSLYTAHLGPHIAYHTSLEHLAHYYRNVYRRTIRHWQALFGVDIAEVCYEDLVADVRSTAKKLLMHCGLEWTDACLAFADNPAPVFTASMQAVRKPLSAASLSRWRAFESHLAPLAALRNCDGAAFEASAGQ